MSEMQRRRSKARKYIESLLPIARSISNYSRTDAISDFITGITVGLIIVPQSIVYVAPIGLSAKVN